MIFIAALLSYISCHHCFILRSKNNSYLYYLFNILYFLLLDINILFRWQHVAMRTKYSSFIKLCSDKVKRKNGIKGILFLFNDLLSSFYTFDSCIFIFLAIYRVNYRWMDLNEICNSDYLLNSLIRRELFKRFDVRRNSYIKDKHKCA